MLVLKCNKHAIYIIYKLNQWLSQDETEAIYVIQGPKAQGGATLEDPEAGARWEASRHYENVLGSCKDA